MTVTIQLGGLNVQVTAEPLTKEAFAPFGDVVTNPRPHVHPSAFEQHANDLPPNTISANQGSAIQYRDLSNIKNLYPQAPSKIGQPKMSMFVCAARQLDSAPTSVGTGAEGRFNVAVLERHPYTTQTFTPVASSASRYLVIVAPSLPPSSKDDGLPVPAGQGLPGRGLPDVRGLKAFVAKANQAVTYGAGTWHAPMAVLGKPGTALDFVVFQFGSGEGIEDCQLVDFETEGAKEPKVNVIVPRQTLPSKL